jgi:monofunctional glycosyltransferase
VNSTQSMARLGVTEAVEEAAPRKVLRQPWPRKAGFAALVLLTLPIVLTLYYAVLPPPISSLMIGRLLTGHNIDYRWVPLQSISPELAKAVVSAEDARFCEHQGIDWLAVQDLVEEAFDNDEQPMRGASTIAMQTAKNLFLWEGRSVIRKALEMPLALWIDAVWPKRRVIEVYLNIAEWAPGVYGAEAAARKHFGKSASKLSRREAALMASVLPNPIKRHAGKPSGAVRRRANLIERRTVTMGALLNCLRS